MLHELGASAGARLQDKQAVRSGQSYAQSCCMYPPFSCHLWSCNTYAVTGAGSAVKTRKGPLKYYCKVHNSAIRFAPGSCPQLHRPLPQR